MPGVPPEPLLPPVEATPPVPGLAPPVPTGPASALLLVDPPPPPSPDEPPELLLLEPAEPPLLAPPLPDPPFPLLLVPPLAAPPESLPVFPPELPPPELLAAAPPDPPLPPDEVADAPPEAPPLDGPEPPLPPFGVVVEQARPKRAHAVMMIGCGQRIDRIGASVAIARAMPMRGDSISDVLAAVATREGIRQSTLELRNELPALFGDPTVGAIGRRRVIADEEARTHRIACLVAREVEASGRCAGGIRKANAAASRSPR